MLVLPLRKLLKLEEIVTLRHIDVMCKVTLVTGSIVVEKVFAIPGLGRYFVDSAFSRDYTTVMGTVLFYAVLLILANLVVDVLYQFMDPRIQYERP